MTPSRFGFTLVILFLVFDYARPQDIVPAIGALRPALILTALMVIAWLRTPKTFSFGSRQITLMLYLLALMTVHIPLSANHYWAFLRTEEFLLLLPFCFSVILYVDAPERLVSFLRWWVILACYVATKAILHPAGAAGSSFLGDPNDLSLLIDMMLPFVLCMFVYEKRRLLKLFYLGTAFVCMAGIVSTASRGGFLGLAAMLIVLWWVSPRKGLVLVLVGILGIATYQLADQKYLNRMSTIQATDQGTAKERLESWKAAWVMFEDHPLGVGPDNFPIHFHEYQSKNFTRNMWGRAAHSLWFTLLAELGIPGVILYVLIFRANWKSIKKLHSLPSTAPLHRLAFLLSIAFTASIAGFFAAGTFLSVLFYPHYWFVTAMIVATEKSLLETTPTDQMPAISDTSAAATLSHDAP
jgi:putative inorganic carbon (hco3(-)) transporter